MTTELALTIIGSIFSFLGILFITLPKEVNKKTVVFLGGEPSNFLRADFGGAVLAIGIISLFCRELPTEYAHTLLTALGSGLTIVALNILSMKYRGFCKRVPVLPIVFFAMLSALAFFA